MKNTRKRIVSLLLALCMVLSMLPATQASAADMTFIDVKPSHWFYNAVRFVFDAGLMQGMDENRFSPGLPVTRAMFVTTLYRLDGQPETTGTVSFTDVSERHWYYNAVRWAYQNNIVAGYSDSTFAPNINITREQFATIIYRYTSYRGIDVSLRGDLTRFSDRGSISSWAVTPLSWAVAVGLIQGRTSTTVVPKGTATRAEAATIFQRYCQTLLPEGCFVKFEANGGTPVSTQFVMRGFSPTVPLTPEKEGFAFAGWFLDPDLTEEYDFISPIFESIVLYAKWISSEEMEATVDMDGDGVDDRIEEMLGTSPRKADTDGDGLNDYVEIYLTNTDPCLADTDGNGIKDYDEDADGDGLSNGFEVAAGTKCNNPDSDSDGLTDYEELYEYITDPLKEDTDGDGLTDGEEIALGLLPTAARTDGVTLDSKRTFPQVLDGSSVDPALTEGDSWLTPSISAEVAGLIDNNVYLYESSDYSLDSNRSVVSDIVGVETSYTSPLTMTFSYDADYTGDPTNLTVMSITEDGLELVDTVVDVDRRSIRCTISDGGDYCVVDLDEFLKGLGIDVFANLTEEGYEALMGRDGAAERYLGIASEPAEPEAMTRTVAIHDNDGNVVDYVTVEPQAAVNTVLSELAASAASGATGKADIVFAIDTTGSMSDVITNVCNNVSSFATTLVEKYNIDANFALIEFRDITYDGMDSTILHKSSGSNWFTNVYSFTKEVRALDATGGGDDPETPIDALEMARRLDWRGDATKFIILVTDADTKNDNRYGVRDLSEMGALLSNDGIIASAITYNSYVYSPITTPTDGLYGYIYGNFADILLALADRVGTATNTGGEWIFLSDFQAVKLKDTLENAAVTDSDGDGLMDNQELTTSFSADMSGYISRLLNKHAVPAEYYTGKTNITVWNYRSNPCLLDTDFDGISDGTKDYDGSVVTPDATPRDKWAPGFSNYFSGSVTANDFTFDVNFTVDYTRFFKSLTSYRSDLSRLGILYSIGAYHDDFNVNNGTSFHGDATAMMKAFGMKNVKDYKLADYFSDDDISEIIIGHRKVSYQGTEKEIILVAVRGTDATIEEWSSNFDVGANTSDYWDVNNPYWRNKNHHKGFDVPANRLYDYIVNDYLAKNVSDRSQKVFFFTGHSRGAAISNILAAMMVNQGYETTSYNFATPNTTLVSNYASYSTIFNVMNKDDIVPYLPLNEWGFHKYGTTYSISVEDHYEDCFGSYNDGTWEKMFGCDYNANGNLTDTLTAFRKVTNKANGSNQRNELYQFTGADNTFYTYSTKYDTLEAAENAARNLKSKHGTRISRHCRYFTLESTTLTGRRYYQVMVEQTPSAMMMILTDVIGSKQHVKDSSGKDSVTKYSSRGTGEDTFFGHPVGFYVASRYEKAKKEFVWSGADSAGVPLMGGMVHTHMPGTYYLIVLDTKKLIP